MQRRRNKFREWSASQKNVKLPQLDAGTSTPEPDVHKVAEWFRKKDPTGAITAEVIRDSIDILLDGQRTGRWCYAHLSQTEKAHLGTVIEIELQKEFGISDDGPLDYAIEQIPVDCKFSAEFGKWQIPREMYRREEDGKITGTDHVALLVWAEEGSRTWRAGLLRITGPLPGSGANGDRKRTLRQEARSEIYWIWPTPPLLPRNTLLELPEWERASIFAFSSSARSESMNYSASCRGRRSDGR